MSPVIALVGAPNSGKTTLYNWLTGSRFKTVNYPGATVEYSLGDVQPALGSGLRFMDTPGVYGLNPKSADEEVTIKAIYEHGGQGSGPVDGIVVVIDGTQLERHLQLVLQVRETGFPFLVVVTMADLLRKAGVEIDWAALSRDLGAEILPFEGLLGGGLRELVAAAGRLRPRGEIRFPVPHLQKIHDEARLLAQRALLSVPKAGERLRHLGDRTRRIDHVLLHPFAGPMLFFGIMTLLFASIYWMAAPFMDLVDGGFSSIADTIRENAGGSIWGDFAADGIVASFGAVLIFVPQIFILFVGIGLLESTGYLARAATLIDRVFSAVGLTGRSFVPILSGFSCAVPAMIASRNIASRRDRWITNFVIPLMTCSARLPVYALLLGFLFFEGSALLAGFSLALLYMGSLFVGAAAAAILNRLIPKDTASSLLMELPMYRRPRVRVVLRQSLTRTWSYVRRAGPIIFVIAVVMWFGSNFPHYDEPDATVKLEQSYAGRVGQVLEPVFRPMGVDWRVGVGLISAFAAREVFVSTMAVTFHVSGEDEDTQAEGLLQTMKTATFPEGGLIFTPATVMGLLVFFMIALQCMSTFAVAQKESGSWKFAWGQLIVFNAVAYGLAVAIVQGLRAVGVA